MSNFRKYGGMNYSAVNNITKSYISNVDLLGINKKSGQTNSKEIYESHIDMSGNSILHLGCLYFQDGTSMCGVAPAVDLLNSNNNWYGKNNFNNVTTFNNTITSTATQPSGTDNSTHVPTTAWVQSAIGNLPNLISSNNTWTGLNTFSQNVGIGTSPTSVALTISGNINASGSLTSSTANFTSTTPPTSTQTIPSSQDSSTVMPTTKWVQSAISRLLGLSNTWTSTNTFNNIKFADNSIQSSAYTGAGATAVGTWSNATITLDANGKITAISSGSTSPWEKNGTNIYYNSGNVCIGTSTPSTPSTALTVIGSVSVSSTLTAGTASFTSTTPPTSSQTIPSSQDSSTVIPTTAWVQSAVSRLLGLSNTWTSTNTFSQNVGIKKSPTVALDVAGDITSSGTLTAGTASFTSTTPPTSSQTIPASQDSSTIIPTTRWVQSAIARLLGLSNTWTGTNTFSQNVGIGTTPTTALDIIGNLKINGKITINGTSNTIVQSDTSNYQTPNVFCTSNINGSLNIFNAGSPGLGGTINVYDSTENTNNFTQIYQGGTSCAIKNITNGGRMVLYLNNSSGNELQALTLTQYSNATAVGINKSTPTTTLDVNGHTAIALNSLTPGSSVLDISSTGILNRSVSFVPYSSGGGAMNPLNTSQGDILLLGAGDANGNTNMKMFVWSGYNNGLIITPISTAIYGGNSNILVDGNTNQITFNSTNPPVSNALQPSSSDSSTKIPTTAWVQSAISSPSSGLLSTNNTWTGTNNFTKNVGIGTTNALANLDVNGSINASGTASLTSISTSNPITINNYVAPSNSSQIGYTYNMPFSILGIYSTPTLPTPWIYSSANAIVDFTPGTYIVSVQYYFMNTTASYNTEYAFGLTTTPYPSANPQFVNFPSSNYSVDNIITTYPNVKVPNAYTFIYSTTTPSSLYGVYYLVYVNSGGSKQGSMGGNVTCCRIA